MPNHIEVFTEPSARAPYNSKGGAQHNCVQVTIALHISKLGTEASCTSRPHCNNPPHCLKCLGGMSGKAHVQHTDRNSRPHELHDARSSLEAAMLCSASARLQGAPLYRARTQTFCRTGSGFSATGACSAGAGRLFVFQSCSRAEAHSPLLLMPEGRNETDCTTTGCLPCKGRPPALCRCFQ